MAAKIGSNGGGGGGESENNDRAAKTAHEKEIVSKAMKRNEEVAKIKCRRNVNNEK